MSVLVACRGLARRAASEFDRRPIATLSRAKSYLEALALWQVPDLLAWEAITTCLGRSWGDLVNDATADLEARKTLVEALSTIARSCDELALWYAGFPDDVPCVATPSEFERVVEEQLATGDLEPAVRMVRHSYQCQL